MATNTKRQPEQSTQQVAIIHGPRLAYPTAVKEEFGIAENEWRTLVESIFPGAQTIEAVNMALAYCKRRNLDIFKRPVHIVPIYSSTLRKTVETVWPGIAELRTTAMRTGSYAGLDQPRFGPKKKEKFEGFGQEENEYGDKSKKKIEVTVEYPEWCEITVWRFVKGQRVPFPGPRVEWTEIFSRKSYFVPVPNDRWTKAPLQMLEKCAEAAALRRAFPEELGDEFSAEEAQGMADRAVDITGEASAIVAEPRREDYREASGGAAPPSVQPGEGQSAGVSVAPAVAGGTANPPSQPEPTIEDDTPDPHLEVVEFTTFRKTSEFIDAFDDWLKDPRCGQVNALRWKEHYAGAIEACRKSINPGTREYIETLMKMLDEVIAGNL